MALVFIQTSNEKIKYRAHQNKIKTCTLNLFKFQLPFELLRHKIKNLIFLCSHFFFRRGLQTECL